MENSVKKGSWFISSCHDEEESEGFRRKSGTPGGMKKCPACCKDYNKHTGPVDQCNTLHASYSLHLTHHRRCRMPIINYCFDLLLINSYIYYKFRVDEIISHKAYRVELLKLLNSKVEHKTRFHGSTPFERMVKHQKRTISPSERGNSVSLLHSSEEINLIASVDRKYPMRMTNVGDHIMECKSQVRYNCKYFYAVNRKESQVVTFCSCCQVYLCCIPKRNCFKIWHSPRCF